MCVQSQLKNLLFLVVLISMISSCSDDNNNNDEGEELLADIQGLWQLDSEEGDINYIHVDNRIIYNYDYMGDDFDEGPECYEYSRNEILSIEGDEVTFMIDDDPEDTETVTVIVSNNVLSVSQTFAGLQFTQLFNRSNTDVDSFTPICEDSDL